MNGIEYVFEDGSLNCEKLREDLMKSKIGEPLENMMASYIRRRESRIGAENFSFDGFGKDSHYVELARAESYKFGEIFGVVSSFCITREITHIYPWVIMEQVLGIHGMYC